MNCLVKLRTRAVLIKGPGSDQLVLLRIINKQRVLLPFCDPPLRKGFIK